MFRTSRKIFLVLAFCAAAWVALGNSVRVLVALSMNQSIDITVCTSVGTKTISVAASVAADDHDTAVVAMKHCGNAALTVLFLPPSHPTEISFATPGTVASWQFVQVLGIEPQRTWENAPPPLRGPPASLAA